MPHVVLNGRALFWRDCDRRRASVCVEMAVQSLSCSRIADLLAGDVVHELDARCCSVTRVDTRGEPTWFAAVSPSKRVCTDEDTILVPLGTQSVRTVIMCGLHLNAHFGSECDHHRMAVRSLLHAQKFARHSDLVTADQLDLRLPRDIFCRETCTALVGTIVPVPRQVVLARLPEKRFYFDDLPSDLQILVAAHCACRGHLRLPDLALVSKTFHWYATMARNFLASRLEDELSRCNAKGALNAGAAIACRGIWPLRAWQHAPSRIRPLCDFNAKSLHGRSTLRAR